MQSALGNSFTFTLKITLTNTWILFFYSWQRVTASVVVNTVEMRVACAQTEATIKRKTYLKSFKIIEKLQFIQNLLYNPPLFNFDSIVIHVKTRKMIKNMAPISSKRETTHDAAAMC